MSDHGSWYHLLFLDQTGSKFINYSFIAFPLLFLFSISLNSALTFISFFLLACV